MQLAGYLQQRALQEWNLLPVEDKATYEAVTRVLCTRLDPGNRVLAAQDFRHAVQGDTECVADYIRRLKRLFQIAYASSLSLRVLDVPRGREGRGCLMQVPR